MMQPRQQELAMLLTLMLVMFTTIVDFMLLMPLASYLMAEFHVQTTQFGLLVSSYSLAAGVSALLASSIADHFDRRHALLFCFTGLALATFSCALATGFASLLLARTVAGIFGGVIGSICLAIVGDLIPMARRGQAMSWVMLGFSLSAVAGVPLGLWLAAHAGWRYPFMFLGGFCVVLFFAIWRFVPPVRAHLTARETHAGFWESYMGLLREPNHWKAVLVTALLMLSGFMVIPFIAPAMVANTGMQNHDLMYIYLVGGALTIWTRPIIGRLTDRFGAARIFPWLVVASFAPIILVTQTPPWPLWAQLAGSGLFFVLVSGRFIPATALVTSATQPQFRGRLMAFNSAVQNFASGLASLLAGSILTQAADGRLLHYGWIGLLSCLAGLGAIFACRAVRSIS